MLITNQARLLELVTALRDHISFFLENVNTGPKRGGTGHTIHSNFIKEISNFLQYTAGIKSYMFENKAFIGLIKQPHILKLTSILQASINLFLETLESGPKKIDESVLSRFLQQIFNFIGKILNPPGTPSTSLIPSTITARDLHSHRQSPPAINDPPQSTVSTCALSAANPDPVENSHSRKAKPPSTFNRGTIASQQNSLLKQRGVRNHQYLRCALLFSNPSPDVTLLDISEWCCGGPLVGISRQDTNKFRVDWSYSTNFLIQFVRTDDAAAFLAFAKSLKRDSSLLAGQTADISIDWNPYQQNVPLPTTVDALNNPARRVLIFQGYPVETVTKDELVEMFRALSGGSAFKAHTILSFEIFAENRETHLLFNKVEVAAGIMELYNLGRLGDRFKNCRVLFGRDPSDRPFQGYKLNDVLRSDCTS